MSKILVTGASGFIGQTLLRYLIKEQVSIKTLSRSISISLPTQTEIAVGDLTTPATLENVLQGVIAVCHLAGELRDLTRLRSVNVEGIKNLLAACEKHGVQHVVHLSSVGVIGSTRVGEVDETVPCQPLNEYEQTKYEAEQYALDWSARTGISVTVLRPTIVFGGAHRTPDSMLAWLKVIKGKRFINFDWQAVANYIYVEDVAAACLAALQKRVNGVYHVTDACSLTQFVSTAAEILQVPSPQFHVPQQVALPAAWLLQSVWHNAPLTVARVKALSNRTKYISKTIETDLGWRPAIGWREGLRRTIAWYSANSLL